jgi:hypothetical protein
MAHSLRKIWCPTYSTVQGLDHDRSEFEREFGGNPFKGMTLFIGEKGWPKHRDNKTDLYEDTLANEKRRVYLEVIPSLPIPLNRRGFNLEGVAEEKVGDKPAAGTKVTRDY